MQINFGTHWNVVSIGCTGCIKINFADGVVLFLAVHYGAILIYWTKKCNFVMVLKTFEVKLD